MNATSYLASSLVALSPGKYCSRFAARIAHVPEGHPVGFLAGMHTQCGERALAKNQLLALPEANAVLVCLEGELWLTREGDSEDYILGPGQRFVARHGDRVVVQALQPSRLRLGA